MNNILFVIEGNDRKKIKQIERNLKEISKNIESIDIPMNESQLYYKLNESFTDYKNRFEYICLLNEDMVVMQNVLDLYKEYMRDEQKTIYLPLVILVNKKTKGVLNNCLWNMNLAVEVGYLDNALALKQMDTTLYGALIPMKCFLNEEYYQKDILYYQHFYFLNKYADNGDNLIIGIPKVLYVTSIDLSFEGVADDIKIKNFKLAGEINIESNLTIV